MSEQAKRERYYEEMRQEAFAHEDETEADPISSLPASSGTQERTPEPPQPTTGEK